MIFKLDHIGITVDSLAEARARLEPFYPAIHVQYDIEAGDCLNEVALQRQPSFAVSLHTKEGSMTIELIEYPRTTKKVGSMVPWEVMAHDSPEAIKAALRAPLEQAARGFSFSEMVSLVSGYQNLNAVVIPVPDPGAELAFWQSLNFDLVSADDELVVLRLSSRIPPVGDRYVLLHKADYSVRYHTDLEGINEIAILCSSCSSSLKAVPEATFRSSVSRFFIGRQLDIGYLRSPTGILVELFSLALS
jgi:hypothetical protein